MGDLFLIHVHMYVRMHIRTGTCHSHKCRSFTGQLSFICREDLMHGAGSTALRLRSVDECVMPPGPAELVQLHNYKQSVLSTAVYVLYHNSTI